MSFQVGDVVGDYRIVEILGRGGMGQVFRVHNLISDRMEAMKVVLPEAGADAHLANRFLSEIKVHASLDHPNIVRLHTALRLKDQMVMIMEFVEGVSLDSKLRSGPITVAESLDYACQVLSALEFAHARGVIHRDIKPANIIETRGGLVKLTDFGIARFAGRSGFTSTAGALGSVSYISPEQVSQAPLTPRSDLYSFGITLYEMLTAAKPITGDSDYAILYAHLHQTPVPPRLVRPEVPLEVSRIVMKALEKNPDQRLQSATEFRAALAATMRTEASSAISQTSTPVPGFDEAQLTKLEIALTPALGPIAKQMVRRAARQAAGFSDLCTQLAGQIPGEAARAALLRSLAVEPGAPQSEPSVAICDPAVLDRAKRKLAAYLGPIAGVLADRAAKTARTPQELYAALAAHISSERDRKEFLSTV